MIRTAIIHLSKRSYPILFKELDNTCFYAKNLYNKTRYIRNNFYLENNQYLSAKETYSTLQQSREYKSLPAKVAQLVIDNVLNNEKSFFKAIKQYKQNSTSFTGMPKFPCYKPKDGRSVLFYNNQAISKKFFKQGELLLSGTTQVLPLGKLAKLIKFEQIKEVRVVPTTSCYKLELVYELKQKANPKQTLDQVKRLLSLDLGINRLITGTVFNLSSTSSKDDVILTGTMQLTDAFLVSGLAVKHINYQYNKNLASYQAQLAKCNNKSNRIKSISESGGLTFELKPQKISHKIKKLIQKRNNRINALFHKISKVLVKACSDFHIDTIVIGKNDQWKTGMNLGKVNNQNFISIPFVRLIQMISYKAEALGIRVELQEESYTSKASALDNDFIPTYTEGNKEKSKGYIFSGKRQSNRALYKTSEGRLINADVNGSINIGRKYLNGKCDYQIEYDKIIKGLCSNPCNVKILTC